MNLKKLFLMLTFFVLVGATTFAQTYPVVYVDVTNGSDSYTGQNATNNPAGTGPKATIDAGLKKLANNGKLVIYAGTYAGVDGLGANLDFNTATYTNLTAGTTVNIELRTLNLNTNIALTAGNVTTTDLNVAIVSADGARIVQTSTTVQVGVTGGTAGNINLDAATSWLLNTTGTTITLWDGFAFTNAAPSKTGNLSLVYRGTGSFNAGGESNYGSYGTGTITINKTSGTVTFPNNITTIGGIIGTAGSATFSGTVAMGLNDITNNGTGTLTFNGAVTLRYDDPAGAGTDATLSSIENTSTGSIVFNSTATWTVITPLGAWAANRTWAAAANTYLIDNSANGSILLNGAITLNYPFDDGANARTATFTARNNGTGTLTLGSVSSPLTVAGATLVGGSTCILNIVNVAGNGKLNLAGGTVRGNLTNTAASSQATLTGALALHGVLTNAGSFALGTSALTLPVAQNNLTAGGSITSTAPGGIFLTHTAGNADFNGGSLSNVTMNGAGGTTSTTAAVNMTNFTATAGTFNPGAFLVTITGTTTVNGGTVNLNNATFRTTNYSQTSGTFVIANNAASILDIKGNFSRVAGTFTAGAAGFVTVTGTINQTFDGGPLFQVSNITFTNSVGQITVNNTIRASGTATISTATTINFGTVNLVLNAVAAKVINNGNYTTTPGSGGGVILGGSTLVNGGFTGTGPSMEGTGVFGYVTVDVGAGNTASVVNTVTGVKFNGVLRLYSGTLDIGTAPSAPLDFSPFGTEALVVKHLYTAGPQPALTVTAPSTWNAALVVYDLEYAFGNDLLASNVDVTTGTLEFDVANNVRNLTISATTTGAGSAQIAANRTILGNLYVASGARLSLNAAALTASSTTGAHTVLGSVTQITPALATEALILTGSGTLTGGTATANASLIQNLNINTTGTYTVSNFKQLGTPNVNGAVTVDNGTVTLTMPNLGAAGTIDPGNLYNFTQNAGTVVLGYHVDAASGFFVANGSTFDFADWNVRYANVTIPAINVTNVTDPAGPALRQLTVTGHGLAVGDYVVAAAGNPLLPAGTYTVATVVNANTIELTGLVGTGIAADATATTLTKVPTFRSGANASFIATGASSNGYLQIRHNAYMNTAGARVPRLAIDPAATATVFTLTLVSNGGVKDILSSLDNDDIALGANTFTHAGNTWNHGGTATYSGTGTMAITGPVTANFGSNATVPNLTLNNGTNVFTLVDNDGVTATVPSLTVNTTFTSTAGNMNFNAVDVILVRTGGNAFTYTAGTFTATTTTGITATDNQNGELIFNAGAGAQTITLNAACTIPNVTVAGTITQNLQLALTNGLNFTVSKRFVFGAGHTVDLTIANTAGKGNLAFGDGCWVERRAANPTFTAAVAPAVSTFALNNALINAVNPIFPAGGVIDLYYNFNTTTTTAAATATALGAIPAYVVAREMPAAGSTLRNLYIAGNNVHTNTANVTTTNVAVTLNGSKDVKVNNLLHLISGTYDPEPGATTFALEMAANTTVQVTNGNLLNNLTVATNTFWLTGGPVTLIYDNTTYRQTAVYEFPATAGFVSVLDVRSNTGATTEGLRLHAARSVGDLILNTGATGVNDVRFNLHGRTLSVTNVASATLTRGILSSEVAAGGVWTYATLAVTGNATSTANSSIQNVNVTAATVNFAGGFGQTDWDGAGGNALVGVTGVTTTGTATIAAFNGDLTSPGLVTLNGPHTNGTITASTDVTVATGGSMAASSNLNFIGTANSTLTVPTAGATIGGLTLNKTNNTNTITLAGGNLATTAVTNFVNGLFVTGANTLRMFHPLFAAGGQGFTRVGVTGTNISHVVGNVAKASVNAGGPGLGGSSVPRFEFPVGTNTLYRPVAITFNPSFGLPTMPNATVFTVSHVNANPNGAVALPIEDGVAPGIDVARYPAFYWTIAATPNSIGPSTLFDLELTATGFTDYDDINNVRIIRRHGLVTDVSNQWLFQGTIGMPYDNEVNAGVPSIIQKNANAGLRAGGAVFTLGLRSNMSIKTAIPKQWLVLSQGEKSYNLANVFEGNVGSLTYTAQTSNGTIVTTAITGSTLKLTPVAIGDAVVTIVASDAANNDFFAYSFDVNVGLTDVEEVAEIPTEFSLSQNYPNPFNPTTNIKFGLPKESNVTLRIFNILGEEVATLVNKVMPAGFHTINFDASRMTSGMYIYRIEADNFVQVKKMLLMK